ncbi:MAG: hypothetical protein QOJ79_1340 [Actinomycetota bacterium]|nr:hypothetical protein [Actinomycetota bacterium]
MAERTGDRTRVALIRINRGLVEAYRGNFAAAEADLRHAVSVATSLGERFAALDATHNLAWLLGRRGRLPEALALFDEAEAGVAAQGAPLAVYQLDRAEVLLSAGLAAEAQALARLAATELAETGHQAELPEALLLQARAALLAHATSSSRAAADEAARLFEAQDRPTWAAVARAVELQARARAGDVHAVESAADLVVELADRRLDDAEHDVRLAAGTLAARRGDAEGARSLLVPLARRRSSRSASTRTRAWQAELALRRLDLDRRGALRAATAALGALAEERVGLGATDLHASAAIHGADITEEAVELALEDGRPQLVLRWSERARATTLQHPPVRPPDDDALATDLERLRSVTSRRQQAVLEGEPSAALHHQQLSLEDAVRRRSRHARGAREVATAPSLADVRRQLGPRRLVVLLSSRGRLHALLVDRRRSQVVDVCAENDVLTELRHLRLALRRAVLGHPGGTESAHASSLRIDSLLAPALEPQGANVMVPTPGLAGVPWRLLPSLAHHDIEVTPSLALWCRPAAARPAGRRVAVAGPDLVEADAEVRDIARDDADMTILRGAAATARTVLDLLDGADLAHLACHGQFRADNPMFSSLRLADGPLTVYDIERLTVAPAHVVLSACDSARLGDELLGLAAAFFSLGTRTLIASVVPVDDTATRRLMVQLHTRWRAGMDPAAALRSAQQDQPGPSSAAFVCLTAGSEPAQTVSG